MDTQKKSFTILILVNCLVACLVQVMCSSILIEDLVLPLLQLFMTPLLLVCLNIVMALRLKLEFYHYSMSAYLGLSCSLAVFGFILLIIKRPQELPPGEMVLGADLIFVIFLSIIQFFILLVLQLVVYLLFKLFFSKRLLRKKSL